VLASPQTAQTITLANLQFIQARWQEVDTAVDRKGALVLGIVSLYLGLFSLVLAVLPLACNYLPKLIDPPG
jgi:hypothetical protein